MVQQRHAEANSSNPLVEIKLVTALVTAFAFAEVLMTETTALLTFWWETREK